MCVKSYRRGILETIVGRSLHSEMLYGSGVLSRQVIHI